MAPYPMPNVTPYSIDTARIRTMVETGEYYTAGRKWYDELYHRPLAERSYFVLITLMSALTIFLSLMVYSSMYPLSRAVPYTILSNDDTSDDVPFIMPLREQVAEDLNLAMSRFLLKNYVVTREKYKYDVVDLERRFNRIRSTSGEREFGKYQAETNPENPSSPYNKYGRDIQRSVEIQSVQINLQTVPPQASIYFTTNLIKGGSQQVNQWLATIAFRLPALAVDQQTNAVLQWDETKKAFAPMQNVAFEVLDYATQEIGNSVQQ